MPHLLLVPLLALPFTVQALPVQDATPAADRGRLIEGYRGSEGGSNGDVPSRRSLPVVHLGHDRRVSTVGRLDVVRDPIVIGLMVMYRDQERTEHSQGESPRQGPPGEVGRTKHGAMVSRDGGPVKSAWWPRFATCVRWSILCGVAHVFSYNFPI